MEKKISNIVFTKNRPLQLDAYLTSLYRYLPQEIIQSYIIYKMESFADEYGLLFKKYKTCIAIKENDFHSDFMAVLRRVDTEYILFGVDDVVFFDSVDFDLIEVTFQKHRNDIFGFTFRFSPQSLTGGADVVDKMDVASQTIYRLNWQEGKTAHTKYPFELCATIYRTELVRRIINSVVSNNIFAGKFFVPDSFFIRAIGKAISTRSILKSFGYFFSPNTLESWNCRWCQNNKDMLPIYSYFQKLCAVAVQVNMVNISTKNTFDGTQEHTVESLNNKYRRGYRLDIDFVAAQKPLSPSCGKDCFRLVLNSK